MKIIQDRKRPVQLEVFPNAAFATLLISFRIFKQSFCYSTAAFVQRDTIDPV
jgi:hypothetical protein